MKIQGLLRMECGNVLVKLGGDAKNKGLFTYAIKKAVEGVTGKPKNLTGP